MSIPRHRHGPACASATLDVYLADYLSGDLVPQQWQWVYELNPLVGIVEGFRASVLGLDFNWRSLAVSAAITIRITHYSTYVFKRLEDEFADVV